MPIVDVHVITSLVLQVPGKEEFHETLRYFRSELKLSGDDDQERRPHPPS